MTQSEGLDPAVQLHGDFHAVWQPNSDPINQGAGKLTLTPIWPGRWNGEQRDAGKYVGRHRASWNWHLRTVDKHSFKRNVR